MDKPVNRKLLAKLALLLVALLHLATTGGVAAQRKKAASTPFNCHKNPWVEIDLGDGGLEGGTAAGICFRKPTRSEEDDIPDRTIKGAPVVPFFIRGRITREDGSLSCCEDYDPCDPAGPYCEQNKKTNCREAAGEVPDTEPQVYTKTTRREVSSDKFPHGEPGCEITFDSTKSPEIMWVPNEPTNMTCETLETSTDTEVDTYTHCAHDNRDHRENRSFVKSVTTKEKFSCRGTAPSNPGDHVREVQTHFYPGQLYFAVNFKNRLVSLDVDGAPDAYYKGDQDAFKKQPPGSNEKPGIWGYNKEKQFRWFISKGKVFNLLKRFRENIGNISSDCKPQLAQCDGRSPCPGNDPDFCQSHTSYYYSGYPDDDQRKYLNAITIPFFVAPISKFNKAFSFGELRSGKYGIGDVAMVFNGTKASPALPGDTHPGSLGHLEFSDNLFNRLGWPTTFDVRENVDKASVVMFFNGSQIFNRDNTGFVKATLIYRSEAELLEHLRRVENHYNSQLLGVHGMKAIAKQLNMSTQVDFGSW